MNITINFGVQVMLAKNLKAQPIRVEPAQAYVTSTDDVTFTLAEAGAKCFTLFFPKGSPFGDDELHSGPGKKIEAIKVNGSAAKRPYRYYVAVATADDIFMIASCPEIIIR